MDKPSEENLFVSYSWSTHYGATFGNDVISAKEPKSIEEIHAIEENLVEIKGGGVVTILFWKVM